MAFPVVKEACCGCPLKPSAIFGAWLSLVLAVLGIVNLVFGSSSVAVSNAAASTDHSAAFIRMAAIVVLLIMVAVNAMILYGIHKVKPSLVLVGIFIKLILIILAFIGFFKMLISGQISVQFFTSIALEIVELYFLFITFSYYTEITTIGQQGSSSNKI